MPYKNKEDLKACRKRNYHKWKDYFKEYKEKNQSVILENARHAHRKRLYNLSKNDFLSLLEKQQGKCAICNKEETCKNKNGIIRPLCVDHCHATGRIRGLLCNHCNSMLGSARDNISTLENGIRYLKGFLNV